MNKRLLLAASAAILITACDKKAEDTTAATNEPAANVAANSAVVEPMVEAVEAAPIGSATVTIGLNKDQGNAPYFAGAGAGFCNPGGGCAGGIAKDTGDVDLSGFPPGDVSITVDLDDDAYNAGYRFPVDAYQAVGIATWPAGASTEPPAFLPLFGKAEWPATEFEPPTVSSDQRAITFLDLESAKDSYQYAIAIDGPGGRKILDPEIKNGGHNR